MTEGKNLILHIKAIGISDLPTIESIGQLKPYLVFKLNTSTETWKTRTHLSVFDETCHIPLTLKDDEKLIVELYSETAKGEFLISSMNFKVTQFKVGENINQWYNMKPEKKVEAGGRVHLSLNLGEAGQPPFPEQ